jgi:cytochrome c oxidase assembly protein subunit 11
MNEPHAPDGTSGEALQRRSNVALVKRLGIVVVAMFGFGYALVPFYEQICDATGMRNILQPDQQRNTQVDASRTVRLEFDSNLRNLPWTFRPLEPVVNVHPGELRQVVYEVVNNTGRAITGQAIPSYVPQQAVRYFRKLDCFCFAKQTLQPGETRKMPIVFVIDPELPADVTTITLSYTFFEVEGANDGRINTGAASGVPAPAAIKSTTRSDS